jgi:predicted nicotinamide N-methyase
LSAATVYTGPVTTEMISVGGRALKLVRPAEPDRMLEDPSVLAWNRLDDYMPYWAYLWPGAFLLAEAVTRETWAAGTPALELGCGLGLAGLAGMRQGLRVTFTDYDTGSFDFLTRSAAANGFALEQYSFRRLDWRAPSGDQFPVILGADVLYEKRLIPLVVNVLSAMLAPGGIALIADPYRASAESFPALAEASGLQCEAHAVSAEPRELGVVRGTLHRVVKIS